MFVNNRFTEEVLSSEESFEKVGWTKGVIDCYNLFQIIFRYTDNEFSYVFGTNVKDVEDLVMSKTVEEVFAKVEQYESKSMKQELTCMINKYGKENIMKVISNM